MFKDDDRARRELRDSRLREARRVRDILTAINSRPGEVICNIGGRGLNSRQIEEAMTGLIDERCTDAYYRDMDADSRRKFG